MSALEIEAMVAVATAAAKIIPSAVELLNGLRAKRVREAEEEIERLRLQMKDIDLAFSAVGELSYSASRYLEMYEGVLKLETKCNQVDGFLVENRSSLGDSGNSNHHADWRMLELLFRQINANAEEPARAMMGLAEYFDRDDQTLIRELMRRFTDAHSAARGDLRAHTTDMLERSLGLMGNAIRDASLALRRALRDKILRGLEVLKLPG